MIDELYVHDVDCDMDDDCTCAEETFEAHKTRTVITDGDEWLWEMARALRNAAYRSSKLAAHGSRSVRGVLLAEFATFVELSSAGEIKQSADKMGVEIRNSTARLEVDRWQALDVVFVRDFGVLRAWVEEHAPSRLPYLDAADVDASLVRKVQ